MDKLRILMTGGGTGGHIYPAIAIANEFKAQFANLDILFVGALGKMEMELVPKEHYKIEGIWISGFYRKKIFKNILLPIKIMLGLQKAKQILNNYNPHLVVGTGGFASALVLYAAGKRNIPCYIQEQNSFPGLTNKLLSKYARKIFVSYKGMSKYFPKRKIVFSGNPIRQNIVSVEDKKQEAKSAFNIRESKTVLLVIGGSNGSKMINKFIEDKLDFFNSINVHILWQCGELYLNAYDKYNKENYITVEPFIRRMDLAYALADIIISRSGALAISELCVVGKPVIFIPSPNVAEDHQTKNALNLVKNECALMYNERDLFDLESNFENDFQSIIDSPKTQNLMKLALTELAKPMASRHIVEEIKKDLSSGYKAG